MTGELFSIVAPVFICAGIGFLWARLGRAFPVEFVTTLVTNIGAPSLVFHTLANLSVSAAAFATMVGATVAVFVACAAVGWAVLAVAGWPQRAFLPPLLWPNSGNMGLPLNYLAFGDVGLGLAIAVFTVYAVTQMTLGMALASGAASLRALVRIPLLYAVAAALLFMLTGSVPPKWINATTELLGGITIPMMLITLGISLARLGVRSMPRSVGLAALRLVMGFAVGVAVATLFGLDGVQRGVLIIQSAMPAAVFNYLFAQRYATAPEEVAGIVVMSTALSFLSLPLLLLFVL